MHGVGLVLVVIAAALLLLVRFRTTALRDRKSPNFDRFRCREG